MKTIFEDETIKVCETGRNYDFLATIENKTNHDIEMVMNDDEADENGIKNHIKIPANDWVGLFNMQYVGNTKQALEQGDYQYLKIDIK